jgi:hypothetical protein
MGTFRAISLMIQRKNKRREKSRAGMVRTYSGSGPRVKAKEAKNRPKLKDLADFRYPRRCRAARMPSETNGFPRRCPTG